MVTDSQLWDNHRTMHGRALATLLEVGLDMRVAARALKDLQAMPQLSRLHLQLEANIYSVISYSNWYHDGEERISMLGVAGLPHLARLTYDDADFMSGRRHGSRLGIWLRQVHKECTVRGVEVERVEAPKLPGLQGRTPWDAAEVEV